MAALLKDLQNLVDLVPRSIKGSLVLICLLKEINPMPKLSQDIEMLPKQL